jgi:phosphatidylserine/phosphatidylglycerophosphate/cardiolipin synthase-like enzyme
VLRKTIPFLLMALAAPACGATSTAAGAAHVPPVQLVETRPIETTLGDPSLPSAHDVWLEMIRGARHSLDFEEFYLSNWPGEPLEDVLQAITDAARRGVRVRLILDSGMHRTYPMPADSLGKLPGIQVRILDMRPHGGGIQHAKYFLADDRVVFLGSQNTDWRALEHIHELGVRIEDPRVVAVFRPVFDLDWATAGHEPAPVAPPTLPLPIVIANAPGDTVRLWPGVTPRGFLPDSTLWDEPALARLLDSARSEIEAQVLTYAIADRSGRDSTIDQALRRAAARGVRVRLIVSDWEKGHDGVADLQRLAALPNVEVKFSTVPEWSGGYIPFARVEHLKYAVVDSSAAWVGTSNWERGYFHTTRNLAVTLANRTLALEARRIFAASWASPTTELVRPGVEYPAKIRGEDPPPGAHKVRD